jgi:hypothetical protein
MKWQRLWFMVRQLMAPPAVMCPVLCGCDSLEEYPDNGSVFEATVGARPGPGVTILQAYGRAFGDNATGYLWLKASPGAFAALTGRGFMPITAGDYQDPGRVHLDVARTGSASTG